MPRKTKTTAKNLPDNCSPEEEYQVHLTIAIKHFNMLDAVFWTNTKTAEQYAKKHGLKEELPLKFFKLAAYLKTNRQEKIELLKKELHLTDFDDNLLRKINFKIDSCDDMLPALEKSFPREFDYNFERLLIFYKEKGLSALSEKEIHHGSYALTRAHLMFKYEKINDPEKIIEHGRMLMKSTWAKSCNLTTLNNIYNLDDSIERYRLAILLDAAYLFIDSWREKNKDDPFSNMEIGEIITYAKEIMRVCLNRYFANCRIQYNGSNDLFDMFDFFKNDLEQNDRIYTPELDTYTELIASYESMKNIS